MKKIVNVKLIALALFATAMGLSSCSDEFLEEKRDLNNVSAAVYDNFTGAQARLDDIYAWCQPGGSKVSNRNSTNMGDDDDMSKSTEEYVGLSAFVDPQVDMNTVTGTRQAIDYFYVHPNNIQNSVWGRIRNVNDVIRGISNGTLPKEEKDQLLGQAYFWRAWCYYQMVKFYGGIPIVKEPLDPIEGPGTPRSSAAECFQFMFDDLDNAATMLEATTATGWSDPKSYGRITTAAALALKGRLMVLWASPLFNRANDVARWEAAYTFINESMAKIDAAGHGLVPATENTAAGWADMFVRSDRNPEAVMVTLYNNLTEGGAKNSGWEQSIRSTPSLGGGGKKPSDLMVNLFPMNDGKIPANYAGYSSLPTSAVEYDNHCPWKNRDPRFYRTFAFPGVRWTFNGDPTGKDAKYEQTGTNYVLWNYTWYLEDDKDKVQAFRSGSSNGPDGLFGNTKGAFYIRKRSCDGDVSSANYAYNEGGNGFSWSATPWMEIRYAEVLLNYAEAAAGANHTDVAIAQLRKLRERVGYTGDCGIENGMTQAQTMAAILYERQIELAYEGKRFDDMRRWMLYDGGTEVMNIPDAPASWQVTGWGGNTCEWLGFKPFNGQRRENLQYVANYDAGKGIAIGENDSNGDPISDLGGIARPEGVDYRKDLATELARLEEFYDQYLALKVVSGDGYDSATDLDYVVTFQPRYYFLGMVNGAQNNNKDLPQTIGWEDNRYGGANGTFDPLTGETIGAAN